MTTLSKSVTFFIMSATGDSSAPTWEKVGKGFKGKDAKARAEAKAEKLAKGNPTTRYYVTQTIGGFMKRPEVCQRSYTTA